MLYTNVVNLDVLDISWLQNNRYLAFHHVFTTIHKNYLTNLINNLEYLRYVNSSRNHRDHISHDKLCAAVFHVNFVPPQWVMIPCGDSRTPNYFLCEKKLPTQNFNLEYLSKRTSHYCGKKFTFIAGHCFIVTRHVKSDYKSYDFIMYKSLNRYLTFWSIGSHSRNYVIIFNRGIVEYLLTYDFPHQRLKTWHQIPFNSDAQSTHTLVVREKQLYKLTCDLQRYYACPDETCILVSYVCDGYLDCHDGHDEKSCRDMLCANETDCQNQLMFTNTTCSIFHYQCSQGGCIRWDQVCDWHADCADNSDEGQCNPLSDVHGIHFNLKIISTSIFQVNLID